MAITGSRITLISYTMDFVDLIQQTTDLFDSYAKYDMRDLDNKGKRDFANSDDFNSNEMKGLFLMK